MTGAEIEQTFNNPEVRKLEEQHAEIEAALKAVHDQLDICEDVDEQEELRERSNALRENSRAVLAEMRELKKRFSGSVGFKKSA